MGEFPIPVLVLALLSGVIVFLCLGMGRKSSVLSKAVHNKGGEVSAQTVLKLLNCRVRLAEQNEDSGAPDVFSVEICGAIYAGSDTDYTVVRVSIADVTDGEHGARPVHSSVKKWQLRDSDVFCYSAELGKVRNKVTTLSDWTAAAQIHGDWLKFPRKGRRKLEFNTWVVTRDSGEELARGKCIFIYDNRSIGYADLQENTRRARCLAVTLAFAVSAADNKLCDCEIDLIRKWATSNIDFFQGSGRAKRRIGKALDKTLNYFREGNEVDAYKICKEIAGTVPVGQRYEVLELCLQVAQANGVAAPEELALLKDLAKWLEVDSDRFRGMMEKILPVGMHQAKDKEAVLGVTSDMSEEETRKHLNREYRKWHARVTSFDAAIRAQAEHMLKLIAEVRSEYLGSDAKDSEVVGVGCAR